MDLANVPIELINHQEFPLNESFLLSSWQQALTRVLEHHSGDLGSELKNLEQISFVLLDDEQITQVHQDFLNDPTPTDVITFHHGEILISVDTAQRVAQEIASSTEAEVLLYGIHGLVHLHGYTDTSPEEKAQMEAIQVPLWQELKR